jgi:hypothetical protein
VELLAVELALADPAGGLGNPIPLSLTSIELGSEAQPDQGTETAAASSRSGVLVSAVRTWRRSTVPLEQQPSDHAPVIAELRD